MGLSNKLKALPTKKDKLKENATGIHKFLTNEVSLIILYNWKLFYRPVAACDNI
jgi:hypothetical protein